MIKMRKGQRMSKESREKLSNARKKENLSKETIEKLSIANTGENNHFYGKFHSKKR